MSKVALVHHSLEGQTEKIADRVAQALRDAGQTVAVFGTSDAPDELSGFDATIIGASIHRGRHDKDATRFAKEHSDELKAVPSAFFSVSLTSAGEDDDSVLKAHGYASNFIEATDWHPDIVGIFGGALVYTKYGFITRQVMPDCAHEGLPTDSSQDYEYTDWDAVDAFSPDVIAHVVPEREPSAV